MRKSIILVAALSASFPVIALAQSDPDWSRREMERMQAEQERFNARVERQRAEEERMQAQKERRAAEVARQRAEQERGAARGTSATAGRTPMRGKEMDRLSQPLASDRLDVVFKVATRVCPASQGPVPRNPHAFEDAMSLMSDDETDLLMYFCLMYSFGQGDGEGATKGTRAKR